MKKIVLIIAIITMSMQTFSQDYYEGMIEPTRDKWMLEKTLSSAPLIDCASRYVKKQQLPYKTWLVDKEAYWSNGLGVFQTYYSPQGKEIGMIPQYDPREMGDPLECLKVRNGKLTRASNTKTGFTIEKFGEYTLLVERDAKGQPVSAYYNVTKEDLERDNWTMMMQFVLAGNYTTPDGKQVVFGPKMDFYTGDKYETDPGIVSFCPKEKCKYLYIAYGEGRVSRGNPSSPTYGEKMPGAGGAGAIMPPMVWQVNFTVEGMNVKIIHDEPFVDHNPRIEDNTDLTREQGIYEDLKGKWTFASVIPLTHQILRLFPKEVLKLMRGEIYARHGDSFKDPQTQKYFDAQPWYKKTGGPHILTDIEKFNYALIKSAENSK